MAITQIIATLPAVLNDSATFYEDIAERNNSLVTTVLPSINAWATQANTTQTEINEKAAQVAAQAVDGGYSQDYINNNFVGVNNAQNITEVKTFSVSPIVPTPTTDFQVANKKYVDDNNKINILTDKTTPVNADLIAIADNTSSFSLKKLSWANLKATLKTYFDTLYTVASSETVSGIIELATTAEAQAGIDDLRAITPLKLRNALNASGAAPIYACRAWVNFNGTGTVAIRASGNVSSITDNGIGDYTVNFTTAMPDANYIGNGTSGDFSSPGHVGVFLGVNTSVTVGAFRFRNGYTGTGTYTDQLFVLVSFFR